MAYNIELLASVWGGFATASTIRILSSIDILLFVFVSVAWAWQILARLRDFESDEFVKRFRGRIPTREDSINRQAQAMKGHAKEVLNAKHKDVAVATVLGVGVPLLFFGLVTIFADYFFGKTAILIDAKTGSEVFDPSNVQLALFLVDQFLKGALTDIFEVFEYSVSTVSNNSSNLVFSFLVLVFRMLMNLFVIGLVISMISTGSAWRNAMKLAANSTDG